MFVNIRGMKTKIESFREIMYDQKPDVVGIVETMMNERDVMRIEGYDVIRNDRNREGGGVMVIIKDALRGIVVEETRGENESIWMTLNNGRVNVRFRVVYNPQEGRMNKEKLKKIYEGTENEVRKAAENKQKILVIGDMNCKIGDTIRGNKEEVTVGGKMMMEMMRKHKLMVVNGWAKTEGVWTRVSGSERSVIDYMLVNESDEGNLKKVYIDEEKKITPFRVKIINGTEKKIFSDHNMFEVTLNWLHEFKERVKNVKTIMTKNSYVRYEDSLSTNRVSEMCEVEKDIQEVYSKWSKMIVNMEKKCEKKSPKKKESKKIREWRTKKAGIRSK